LSEESRLIGAGHPLNFCGMTNGSAFRYLKTSPEVIRLAVMMYIRFQLSLRNVEDRLHERGIEISHETVRYCCNRFSPLFASEIRRMRARDAQSFTEVVYAEDDAEALEID
jgi:putative transposase